MKKLVILMVFLAFWGQLFSQEMLTYRETTGENIKTYMVKVEKIASGYIMYDEKNEVWLNSNYATYIWKYKDPAKGIDIVAEHKSNKIYITGFANGKKVEKILNSNQQAWYQSWEFGFKNFLSSSANYIKFNSINPDDFELAEFEASKQGIEHVMANGRKLTAFHIKVNLTGFLAVFWHADFWFRVNDFRYVRYESVQGSPGTPLTVKELIKEN